MSTNTIDLNEVQLHDKDTGSTDVQIARLTGRIKHLTEHLSTNNKDHHSRRGLIGLVSQRRKLLKYLKGSDEERYLKALETNGLRK